VDREREIKGGSSTIVMSVNQIDTSDGKRRDGMTQRERDWRD